MNILFVTAYDNMGQQFNGYSLQNQLLSLGHNSNMLVLDKSLNDPKVHILGNSISRFTNKALTKIENELSLHNVLTSLGHSLMRSSFFQEADLVHLQLLHARQFISLLDLPELSKKRPLIWTVHDPWLTTGHCVHPLSCNRWLTGCGFCPDLKMPIPMKRDATEINWKIKKWVMHRTNIHLIAASDWMAERIHTSPILSHLPCSVIPFGIDTNVFHPIKKDVSRAYFNIPDNVDVITFRWAPYYSLKGPEFIKNALENFSPTRETYIITIDAPSSYGLADLQGKFKFIDLEWVNDPNLIAMALSVADVFLMPSIAESFGLMAVEAMACGTPVIVFKNTALENVVQAPLGGIAVPFKDSYALTKAMENILNDLSLRENLRNNALNIVQKHYSMDQYTQSHLKLYSEVIGKQDN